MVIFIVFICFEQDVEREPLLCPFCHDCPEQPFVKGLHAIWTPRGIRELKTASSEEKNMSGGNSNIMQ